MQTKILLIFEKRSSQFSFVFTAILFILIVKCSGEGSNAKPTTAIETPGEAKNLDYEAIREKISEIRHTIIQGLNAIKEDALADKENTAVGRTIADMITKAEVIVVEVSTALEALAKGETLTKKTARLELRKIEREMNALKNKVIQQIQKLSSNTVIKILQEAVECYQRILQLIDEVSALLDG